MLQGDLDYALRWTFKDASGKSSRGRIRYVYYLLVLSTFYYDTVSDSPVGANSDVIADFAAGADQIDLTGSVHVMASDFIL